MFMCKMWPKCKPISWLNVGVDHSVYFSLLYSLVKSSPQYSIQFSLRLHFSILYNSTLCILQYSVHFSVPFKSNCEINFSQ